MDDFQKRWTLENTKAIVTGASRGIGKSITFELLSLGAEVMAVARHEKDLEQLRKETSHERNLYTLVADVGDAGGRKRIINAARERFRELDILVNNAGTNIRKAALDYDEQETEYIFRINLFSAYWLSVGAYPMLRRKGGSIVNISSVAGHTHLRTGIHYAMSKAALNQMTRNLAGEWAGDNIRVNAVSPWYTRTPLAEQVLQDKNYKEEVLSVTPLGRIAEPEEVASLVAYLCMKPAAFITGQVISVDGGFSILGFHPKK